ncbi:hypothetical protein [Jonesia quinghaiensis]|uniref:hypothetical protein n=1 Tax=Jonesia quinghaiensis TaxID=262806 RepID=UPI0003FE44B7|nr:hypothetical protein [Jonesia quinghaiensis]
MKQFIPALTIIGLTVAAAITYVIADNLIVALLLATTAVLVWGFTSIGDPPPRSENTPTPRAIKTYRKQHPGSSIGDAVRALRN